ncbi:uncharacterized protein LOC101863243 [Aplysia californica]|uniref:Uncharacterized protein LOC101863243 n=1 Tax=Aplysia californica TaxID=6500 RepID=A0ABM0JGH2_APLCA|nr:uncharacterized protein LOC101863243 [Aplysia californica]XP_005093161.1 uncharacterized protein LOC101863243 [Aplysia californica]XP_005093162.1 uncharacterized protein LOC101863243 [Aplysia californica]
MGNRSGAILARTSSLMSAENYGHIQFSQDDDEEALPHRSQTGRFLRTNNGKDKDDADVGTGKCERKSDWNLRFSGDMLQWEKVAASFGLDEYKILLDCSQGSDLCDRDYVCNSYLSVRYHRWKGAFYVSRFKHKPFIVPVSSHSDMPRLMSSVTARKLPVVALQRHLVVLEMMVGDRIHAFPIMDCKTRCIKAVYQPRFVLTLIEGAISPDLKYSGLLLYCQSEDSPFFSYSLFLVDNESGEVLSRTCLSRGDVEPRFAFHPAYKSPHVAVVQYSNDNSSSKLVILRLKDEEVKVASSPHLSSLLGSHQLYPRFSPDGNFLLLHKLMDDRFGITSYCDTYIFRVTGNNFQLVKYISSKIPGGFRACRVFHHPEFSRCGQYLRVISKPKEVAVSVFALPSCVGLSARCRQVIMERISSYDQVSQLPIPNKLKDFLLFKPLSDY